MGCKRFGLSRLPIKVYIWIWKNAAKRAGWESFFKKGEGSVMLMEWVTFALTVDEWIAEIKNNLGKSLPKKLKIELLALND